MLYTDVEGSTKLLDRLGAERYAETLELHRSALRTAFEAHGGYEVDTEGDAFFVAFSRAQDAVAAAGEGQRALAGAEWSEGRGMQGGGGSQGGSKRRDLALVGYRKRGRALAAPVLSPSSDAVSPLRLAANHVGVNVVVGDLAPTRSATILTPPARRRETRASRSGRRGQA
jgi:hypothetical protein